MTTTIAIAGYTKCNHIQKIKHYFAHTDLRLICVYERAPATDIKKKYLTLFDECYNLNNKVDLGNFLNISDTVDCVTCTQERDMGTYIRALMLTNKITSEQAELYHKVIDKRLFKEEMVLHAPELVPSIKYITEDVRAFAETVTYPQVVKPSGLAGSIMVRVVKNAEALVNHVVETQETIKKIAHENYNKEVSFVSEEFISGPQYSVNAFINSAGRVLLCPLVRVITPNELGIDDTYSVFQYTTDELTSAQIESLQKSVQKIAEVFQLKSTSAHFDSVLHDEQWKFFEVGLRIGGNRQKLYEYSHDMQHLHNDIKNRLGHEITIPAQKKSVCIVQKASITQGVLSNISYNRSIATEKSPLVHEDKLAKINAEVYPVSLGGGTITRHFVVGNNTSEVLDTSRELFDSITLKNKA